MLRLLNREFRLYYNTVVMDKITVVW